MKLKPHVFASKRDKEIDRMAFIYRMYYVYKLWYTEDGMDYGGVVLYVRVSVCACVISEYVV
jgi:hypothetical protein